MPMVTNFLSQIVPLQWYKPFCELLMRGMKASLLILVVILFRMVFRKIPSWIKCVLWFIVFAQLLIPFQIESPLSAYNYVPENGMVNVYYEMKPEKSEVIVDFSAIPGSSDNQSVGEHEKSTHTGNIVIPLLMGIWSIGIIVLIGYLVISSIRVRMMTRTAILLRENIYLSDEVNSPFVLGLFRPQIYVSSSMDENKIAYVVAHEKAHLKRGDQWWKLLGYLVLCIHWMNPLVWVSYVLFCKDLELACDEKVIKNFDSEEKKAYSTALIDCSMQKKMVFSGPVAFGEVGVKERVKKVLSYKKPALWVGVIAVIICGVIAVCFLTSPQEKKKDSVLTSKEDSGTAPEEVEIQIPQIDLSAQTGADGTTIYYADRHKFIFGSYYGLFVYDMDQKQIVGSVDLEPIGCNFTQGESACEVHVTEDGSFVLLHPMNITQMYVYDVTKNTMHIEEYSLDGYHLYENQYSGDEVGKYASYEVDGEIRYVVLVNDYTIGELGYTSDEKMSSYQVIFEDIYSASGTTIGDTEDGEEDTEEENMDVSYEEVNGQYIVDGDMVYKYKMELIGKDSLAKYKSKFIVLTNDPNITWEQVHKSLISSNSADWLSGTVIIGISVLK